jgi:hypothetical protein
MLLRDLEWSRLSDRKIGEIANVDHKTVGKIRREMSGESPPGKSMGGEFPQKPKPNGKPNGSGSILGEVLRTVSNEALIAECRRRGLMEAADV